MKCAYCGKPLPPKSHKARRFCSMSCKTLDYYYRHQDACKSRNRKNYRNRCGNINKDVRLVECPSCGKSFLQNRIDQIYCSKACRTYAFNDRRRKKILETI